MKRAPKYALRVVERLEAAGYEARFVGGCVRDLLLGRRPVDWDVASAAPPEAVLALFPRALPTGLPHGTVTVRLGGGRVEVTAFRAESGYSDRRRPDRVAFTGDLLGDLARRDFTVNAMAMDAAGRIDDPFGGRADLAAGLIRCVGAPEARFSEDALRLFRALRFSAQLGFAPEAGTAAALKRCAPLAAALSPERVRDELLKTLRAPAPETAYDMLALGLLDAFVQGREAPREPLARLPQYARLTRFCLALEAGGCVADTAGFLRALRLDAKTVRDTATAVAILRAGGRDYKRLLRDHGEAAARLAFPGSRGLRRVLRAGECRSLAQLAVGGGELEALGLAGPEVGRALRALLEHVIDHPADNRPETLRALLYQMRSEGKL